MSECINLSVSLHIRHLSLKLLSAIEISRTRLFILACSSCQRFNVKAPLCKHFLHKVVNNVHLNKSSVQQWRHLAFISCVCCITTAHRSSFCCAPQNGAYPLPGFSFFFYWTQIRRAPWQPGLPWNPAWARSKEPPGWHWLCPCPHQRYVAAAGWYVFFFFFLLVTPGLSGNASPLTFFN